MKSQSTHDVGTRFNRCWNDSKTLKRRCNDVVLIFSALKCEIKIFCNFMCSIWSFIISLYTTLNSGISLAFVEGNINHFIYFLNSPPSRNIFLMMVVMMSTHFHLSLDVGMRLLWVILTFWRRFNVHKTSFSRDVSTGLAVLAFNFWTRMPSAFVILLSF